MSPSERKEVEESMDELVIGLVAVIDEQMSILNGFGIDLTVEDCKNGQKPTKRINATFQCIPSYARVKSMRIFT